MHTSDTAKLSASVVQDTVRYYTALLGKRLEARPSTASTHADGEYGLYYWFSKFEKAEVSTAFSLAELKEFEQVCLDVLALTDKEVFDTVFPVKLFPQYHQPRSVYGYTLKYVTARMQVNGGKDSIEAAIWSEKYTQTELEPWSRDYYESVKTPSNKKRFWQRKIKRNAQTLPAGASTPSYRQISLTQRKLGALVSEFNIPEAVELLSLSRSILSLPGYQSLGTLLRVNLDTLLGSDTLEVVNNYFQEPKYREENIKSFKLLLGAYKDYHQLVEKSTPVQSCLTQDYLSTKYQGSDL